MPLFLHMQKAGFLMMRLKCDSVVVTLSEWPFEPHQEKILFLHMLKQKNADELR